MPPELGHDRRRDDAHEDEHGRGYRPPFSAADAAANVPYYRELFRRLGFDANDVEDLDALVPLPPLTRDIVARQGGAMHAERMSDGQEASGWSYSSGSTGNPVHVPRTRESRRWVLLLYQRQLRWYRHDPRGLMACIRPADHIRIPPDNRPIANGETVQRDRWPGLGNYYATGPFLAFSISNSMDAKSDWLYRHCPAYLLTMTSELEHQALACRRRGPWPGLKGFRAVGEKLTAGMEKRIDETFSVPVDISYGLDELGWVATRCREGMRYHVHSERCIVEIVGDDGTPCGPGETGRVLVTLLDNEIMPLIRYATGDIARTVTGECPCGRTLPAFEDVVGRVREVQSMTTAADTARGCPRSNRAHRSFPQKYPDMPLRLHAALSKIPVPL